MTTLRSKRLATFAAAGLGAVATLAGLAAVPAAHAASCTTGSELDLVLHPNAYSVNITAKGSDLDGLVASSAGRSGAAFGNSTGSIAGNTVDFIVTWTPQSGGGTTHFRGTVAGDGFAHGTASGAAAHDSFGGQDPMFEPEAWDSTNKLTCPAPAAPAAPAAPVVPAASTATVTSDVDLYNVKNEPDGTGHIIGMLRSGSQVQIVGSCQPQSWCQVQGAAVPTGHGWAWGALQLP
jgi:hypothetical protein